MKRRRRENRYSGFDETRLNENFTDRDFFNYSDIDEEYLNDRPRHEAYEKQWVYGGRGQPPVEALMGVGVRPRAGREGVLNFGSRYFSRHGNNFSDYRNYERQDEKGEDGMRIEGLYERSVLETLTRLKQRLAKAKPPKIELSEEKIGIRVGSNKPTSLSAKDEIFAFMHAENLATGACRDPRVEFYTNLINPHLAELQ